MDRTTAYREIWTLHNRVMLLSNASGNREYLRQALVTLNRSLSVTTRVEGTYRRSANLSVRQYIASICNEW